MNDDMKTDTVLAEMFRVKDNLGEQFAWDARAICADLMVKQRQPHPGFPLVENLSASLSTNAQRIAGLPSPLPTEDFMSDDPIIAEVHRIRERLARESQASHLILKDEPPHPKPPDQLQ